MNGKIADWDDPEDLVDALAVKIINEDMGLKRALESLDMDPARFYIDVRKLPDLMAKIDHAREFRADMWADEIVTIGDDKEMPYHQRLTAIDARKWQASKLVPRYKSRTEVDVTSKGERIGQVDDVARRAILAAAQEIQSDPK